MLKEKIDPSTLMKFKFTKINKQNVKCSFVDGTTKLEFIWPLNRLLEIEKSYSDERSEWIDLPFLDCSSRPCRFLADEMKLLKKEIRLL